MAGFCLWLNFAYGWILPVAEFCLWLNSAYGSILPMAGFPAGLPAGAAHTCRTRNNNRIFEYDINIKFMSGDRNIFILFGGAKRRRKKRVMDTQNTVICLKIQNPGGQE